MPNGGMFGERQTRVIDLGVVQCSVLLHGATDLNSLYSARDDAHFSRIG